MGFEWQMNPHREGTWHRRGQTPGGQTPSFHRGLPGYSPSEQRAAPELAEAMRVGTVFLKMETERFGLPAFKILGASWAAEQLLAGRDLEGVTLVTATD
jgi:diaminopropionate ammonia-lyase